MSEQEIDYEGLTQDALRGVVRSVLARVAQAERLPGKHHFYISFDTRAEGVGISKRLRDQYPEEMTIVLQHRFWDLHVHDDRFEVKLTFNSIPERLIIPFKALKVFFDPSVQFGLPFERATPSQARAQAAVSGGQREAEPAPPDDEMPLVSETASGPSAPAPVSPPPAPAPVRPSGRKGLKPVATAQGEGDAGGKGGAQVVSLDAFRKK